MTPSLVHLDHNAATPPCPAARAAAREILDHPELGNPSSSHLRGQRARARLDAARRQIANVCGVDTEAVVFTSGATEADAIGIRGAAQARAAGRGSVAWLGFDHPAITKPAEALVAEGWTAVEIAHDRYGRIDIDTTVTRLAAAPAPRLLAIAAVHHELGVIQPVQALLQASAETAAIDHLHLDLAQAAGRLPLKPLIACADTAALSAQKCGGLAGSGALIVGPGARLAAQQAGRQERGLRGGTQNLIGAVAFGAAATELEQRRRDHRGLRPLRDAVLRMVQLRLGEVRRFGDCEPDGETGHVLSIAMPWADADVWVAALDVEGVAVSAGAACSSGLGQPSPAATALAGPDVARRVVRLSLGPDFDREALELFTRGLDRAAAGLQRMADFAGGAGSASLAAPPRSTAGRSRSSR